MGIKDLTEKILEDYNDIFADIVNVLVFKGKQRIKPETLVNTGVHSQYKNDKTGVFSVKSFIPIYLSIFFLKITNIHIYITEDIL